MNNTYDYFFYVFFIHLFFCFEVRIVPECIVSLPGYQGLLVWWNLAKKIKDANTFVLLSNLIW